MKKLLAILLVLMLALSMTGCNNNSDDNGNGNGNGYENGYENGNGDDNGNGGEVNVGGGDFNPANFTRFDCNPGAEFEQVWIESVDGSINSFAFTMTESYADLMVDATTVDFVIAIMMEAMDDFGGGINLYFEADNDTETLTIVMHFDLRNLDDASLALIGLSQAELDLALFGVTLVDYDDLLEMFACRW